MKKIIEKLFGRKMTAPENNGLRNRRIEALQRRIADFLNSKARAWPVIKLKIMLACFCLIAGGSSSYIAVKALVQVNSPPVVIHAPLKNGKMSGQGGYDTANNHQQFKKQGYDNETNK